jgi:MinD-like ATPase involved in chromosome partitioning or flagellar assembly
MHELLAKMKITNLGVVLNKFSDKSVNSIHNLHVLETIPLSPHISASKRLKNPVVYTHSKSPASNKFLIIARKIE